MASRRKKMARRVRRWIKGGLIVLAVSIASFEIFSLAAIKLDIIAADSPNYRVPGLKPFWVDRNPHFGVWHEASTEYVHTKSCFSVTYRTNAYGARDRARVRNGKLPRVVMLGDSFTEGYGLERLDRMSDRLEAATQAEHLNFGTSGYFGPTQSWLLYKHLAKGFDHNVVIFNLLPDNDFTDDDPAHVAAYKGQYRPYLVEKGGDYQLEYANKDQRGVSEREIRREKRRFIGRMIRNFTYSANAVNYLSALIRHRLARDGGVRVSAEATYAGYFDFTQAQAERLVYVLESLIKEVGERTVIITVIPRPADIVQPGDAPLSALLDVLVADHPNLHIIDLREHFRKQAEWPSYYRDCDGHWSPAGAEAAAGVLLSDPVYRGALQLNKL
jgi:hypothetical protein